MILKIKKTFLKKTTIKINDKSRTKTKLNSMKTSLSVKKY